MPAAPATSDHDRNAARVNGPAATNVLARTSDRSGPGWASAYSWAMTPPIDTPHRWKPSRPAAVTTSCRSAAIRALVYGPGGWLDRPTPRLSKLTTRRPAARNSGIWLTL